MIHLNQLELNNFLSHVDTSLPFDEYNGLVLIEGVNASGFYQSNGSGKSTILEGIIYALTGDTLRGVSVNDVINRNYKKNTRVSLEFTRDDTKYSVSRYRKDDIHGDSLVLRRGEEDISKRVNKDTQKSLEDILGISYKVLVSTMLLGEGLSSRFTQLSDPEKKNLIESTLNLNYDIGKIREKANTQLKSLSIESATLNGEISTLEGLSDSINLTLMEDSIHDNEQCLKVYEETVVHLKEKYDSIYSAMNTILPKINMITEALNRASNLSKEYQDLYQQYTHTVEERDSIKNSPLPVCSLCHQHLTSSDSLNSVLDNYDKSISDMVSKMSAIESDLKSLPNQDLLKKKVESLMEEYEKMNLESQSIMRDHNEYTVKIAEVRKDIESAEASLAQASDSADHIEEKIRRRDEIADQLSQYDYFYKLFSPTGIVVNILSDAIEYINTRLSTYSEVLLEKDYKIDFLKGKISLVDSKGSNYQSLSNGEKRRLDISIQFALHDYVVRYCGMSVDTIFVDEVLDTLDNVGVDNIFDVLRMKLDYCNLKSIYVITHNDALKDKFDQVVTVRKDEKGDSFISYNSPNL